MRSKPSIIYRYPLLYIAGLKLVHGKNFNKRYYYMASFVKPGFTVLEPACGPAMLANYLSEKALYKGFDTNTYFVNYAKEKKIKVKIGDVLNRKSYIKSDIVITCDILHHLQPEKRKQLIRNCYLSTKKILIVCEPVFKEIKKDGFYHSLMNRLNEYIESDGTNDVKTEYGLLEKDYMKQISNGFGVIPSSIKRNVKKIGEDIIVSFYLNKTI